MKRTFNAKIANWRIDDDGILRITANVMKEGVFDYGPDDVPEDSPLRKLEVVREFIPAIEFTAEALKSLEGKPLIIDAHEWRTAENTLEDGLTVGNVAGTPLVKDEFKDKYICADFLIYAPEAIEKIQSGELIEVSAGYDCELVEESGDFAGAEFAARQENLRFNHVLLLPAGQGRLGADVRITNQKEEEEMSEKHKLTVKIANKQRTWKFNSEEDRQEAENMLGEQAAENEAGIEEISNKCNQLEQANQELQKENEMLKAQLEEVSSVENQEALAAELNSQEESIEEIVEAVLTEDEPVLNEDVLEENKAQALNSIRRGNSMAARRANTVAFVYQRRKIDLPKNWSQDAIDGAFAALALGAKGQNRQRTKNQQRQNQDYSRFAQPRNALDGIYNNKKKGA